MDACWHGIKVDEVYKQVKPANLGGAGIIICTNKLVSHGKDTQH